MKKLMSVVVPLACASVYSYPGYSASFDCNKASTYVEYAICDNPQLSKLDDDLAVQYAAEMADAKKLGHEYYIEHTRTTQLNWLLFQRNTCKDTACLIQEYKERLGAKPKLREEWRTGNDIKKDNLPNNRAFGSFYKSTRISVYNPDAKDNHDIFNETNSVDILSVTNKPYLAIIDSALIFDNAHMCNITDQLATWSGNYWTLNSYKHDEPAELRLYPATYKGKSQILLRDMGNQYRESNCGMRGYFDGLVLQKK